MQFSLLYRYDPAGPGPAESEVEQWMSFTEDIEKNNILLHATGFYPGELATNITVDGSGSVSTTSGADNGVPISGYYTIEVDSLDDAITWAKQIPVAGKGTVEIRQVVELDM